jgi:hypothetical protein
MEPVGSNRFGYATRFELIYFLGCHTIEIAEPAQ